MVTRLPLTARTARLSRRTFAALALIGFAGPVLLVVSSALRHRAEIFQYGGTLSVHTFVPRDVTLNGFAAILGDATLMRQFVNTLVVGSLLATLSTAVAFIAGFAFARMRFRGSEALFLLMLSSILMPFSAIVLPMFIVARDLHLLGSMLGYVLPWILSPITIFLMRQSVADVPRELDEATIMDGGGLVTIIRHAIWPNVRPALATAWIMSFLFTWHAMLWPLLLTQDPNKELLQVGILSFRTPQDVQWDLMFAASTFALIPALALLVMFQRAYARTLATTGVK